jgi:hypothetical protein
MNAAHYQGVWQHRQSEIWTFLTFFLVSRHCFKHILIFFNVMDIALRIRAGVTTLNYLQSAAT